MRYLIVIFAFVLFSCNQKQEHTRISNRVSLDKNDIQKSEAKKFVISNVYDKNDSDFSDVQVNYNIGKFVFDKNYDEFIIDSTFDQDIAYQKLKDMSLTKPEDLLYFI